MTKSRMAAPLFLFAFPAAAGAAPLTASQAIENYEKMVSPAGAGGGCEPSEDPEAIIVCGRKADTQRVGPSRPAAGARVNDAPTGVDALTSADQCISRCPQPVQVDVLKAADFVVRGIKRLLDPDN